MNDGYSFRLLELTAGEIERTSALLRLVFPKASHLTPRYLQWKYVQNPDGRALACNAYFGGELVAHVAAVPMRTRLDGKERPVLLLQNAAVHPAHRGRKLQSGVSDTVFAEAPKHGYDFCISTGNRYSTGPLLTRFKVLKPLDARIGFGLPRRVERACERSFERVWSEEARRWRLSNPEQTYRTAPLAGGSAVSAPSGIPGVTALMYEGPDSWHSSINPGLPSTLRLWLGLDPDVDWARSAYVGIPSRLRPSPLNLLFKDLTGGSYLPDPERVAFRAIDFDPY